MAPTLKLQRQHAEVYPVKPCVAGTTKLLFHRVNYYKPLWVLPYLILFHLLLLLHYPYLIQRILPSGLMGVMFAALFGAVMSTMDSLLNSATTIFTMDIYKPYLTKDSSPKQLVKVGRIVTIFLVLIGCLWSPIVSKFEGGLYFFLQVYWGFVIPGVVAVFFFGIIWKKVPASAAIWGMLLNIPVYGLCLFLMPNVSYLHHMEITFTIIALFIIAMTKMKPLEKPVELPVRNEIQVKMTNTIKVWSALLITVTISLYIIFF